MTSKKECYLCTEFHTEQLIDTVYTCDKHTYITIKQVCSFLQITRATVWKFQQRGWLTKYIVGMAEAKSSLDKAATRYSLGEVKKLMNKAEAK